MGTYDTIGGTPRHDPQADYDPVTQLQEAVLALLEAAGIPTADNDRIIDIIAIAEDRLAAAPPSPAAQEQEKGEQT